MKCLFKSMILATVIVVFLFFSACFFTIKPAIAQTTAAPIVGSANTTDPSVPKAYFNVLLLNSYHQGFKWTDDILKGVKQALDEADLPLPYKLEIDYMDTKRINDDEYKQLLFEQLRYKYSKEKIDFVITSDDDAFNFVVSHRDEMFSDIPFAFCGANFIQLRLDTIKDQRLISGVNEDTNIEDGIDAALKLQPGVKNIYLIRDNTTTGVILKKYFDKLLFKYSGYNIKVWDGDMSGEEIISAAKNIPKDSIIFMTIYSYDKNGKFYEYNDLVKELHRVTKVPIYGTWDFYLGDGIVGGRLTSGFSQGYEAGRIAARVLKGEDINNIPIIMNSPNVYMFDYNELKHSGVVMSNLPEDSVIINQPESIYEKYKRYGWVIVSAILLLVIAVVVLVFSSILKGLKIKQQQEIQANLESLVSERTAALTGVNQKLESEISERKRIEEEINRKNEDLEKFNKLAVDRELKMIELKNEIQNLKND